MGSPKQLLPFGEETMLARTIRVARGAPVDRVVVVLGAHAEAIQPTIEGCGAQILVNSDWQEGMASSIRLGVRELVEADGILVLLADQPALWTEWLSCLLERFHAGDFDAVATSSEGIEGPPIVFARSMFPAMLQLQGEAGAKKLLAGANVARMEFSGALADVDTPDDYAAAKKKGGFR